MKTLYTTILCFCVVFSLQAQIFIDNSISVEQMIMDFFDNSCVTPSNITYTGEPISVSYFEAADTDLGVNAGILISSGVTFESALGVGNFASTNLNMAGDPDLEALVNNVSLDAAVIEFDITVAEEGELAFDYVFGSEEYPEFVCSSFNDVFGFLIRPLNGGPYENIATIPIAELPVAINYVNGGIAAGTNPDCVLAFSDYYVSNELLGDPFITYDGMTTVLPASFYTTANQSFHVKIAVADVGDHIFDSGVFISTTSLCGVEQVQPLGDVAYLVSGNEVTVENNVRYGSSWSWDFGDGYTTDERHPQPHTYTDPGEYTVTLITQNFCCADTSSFTVNIEVTDLEEIGQDDFQIFPNPVKDQLNILYPGYFQYQLLDMSGKQIMSGQGNQNLQIAIPELEGGLYFIQIQTDQGSFTQKVHIQ
jgi:hypothetical protein